MPVINIGIDISGLRSGAAQASATLNGISVSAAQAQKSTDALASSISSAAKQVLALVGAYKALDSAKGFAERGIEFNSAMEQSQIGIAAVITSMAKLEDSQGNALKGAEKYAAAQGLASDMMKEIQRLGLETTATTKDLVQGVQNVMGSALNVGMKLEDIPKFAVSAAQAMQTLGIPLEQMRTEVDAILTGQIDSGDDILAKRLGLNKQMIQTWQQQGKLVEELTKKFEPFNLAGKDVANTWRGLTSNLQEAIDIISGQAAAGLSNTLKDSVRNLQSLFITSKDGTTGISQDFANVAAVIERVQTSIGEGILSIVNSFAGSVRSLNAAIGEMGGADAAIADVKAALTTLGAALASLVAVRNSSIRQTAQAVTSEIQFARAVASGNAVILGSAEARRQQALATVEVAQANNAAAQAAVADAQAQLRSAEARMQAAVTARQVAQATTQQAAARNALVQAQERAQTASAALATAEGKLAAATREAATESTRSSAAAAAASTVWGRASTAIAAGATRVANAFKALWAGLGGGVGVAITAIVSGLTYLSSRQDDAAKAADLHTKALETFKAATKGATDETGKLTGRLTALQKAQVEISQRDVMQAYKMQLNEVVSILDSAVQKTEDIKTALVGTGVFIDDKLVSEDIIQTFNSLIFLLKDGQISASDFRDELVTLREKLKETGQENSELVKTIDQLIESEGGLANKLVETDATLNQIKDTLNGKTNAVKEAANTSKKYEDALKAVDEAQKTEVKSAKDAVEWLLKRTEQTESMSAVVEKNNRLKDEAALKELELAEAMAQLTLASELAKLAMSENVEEANKAVNAAVANLQKIQQTRTQFEKGLSDLYAGRTKKKSSGDGGASQIESARQSIARLREEIDQLNGTASKEDGALQKKLADIEKMGKTAKMSAAEIQALKNEYASAFKADTLRDFDKAVLQIEGDAQKLREAEIAETMKEWGLRFADLGMTAEEAAPKLERLRTALQTQESYKDLQTVADFYRELADMSGEYGQSIAYQNQLIDRQAQAWIQAGIPVADVQRRTELMRQELSRDMFDGMIRGARKFGAEYGDMAAQVEGLTTQMGNTIADTLTNAFLTGKLSVADFFNSMISYAAQAASNAFIGQIFGGFGGLFGGGGSFLSTASSAISAIPGAVFHSGGVVGTVPADGVRAVPASAFTNAPRFHSGGGFGADEYPAVLLRGERVLNRNETRAYNAGQASVGMPSVRVSTAAPDVTVNVINQTGQNVTAQTERQQDASGNMNFNVILQQIDSGLAGFAGSGKSKLARVIEKRNGLDRANTLMQGRGRA